MTAGPLPPGQRTARLERFGLPQFARRRVLPPERPVLGVSGEVRFPTQLDLTELLSGLPRREQRCDLHCVATWSACNLCWGGVGLREVLDRIADVVVPRSAVAWLTATGLDGFRSCLLLDDARDAFLADELDGAPLPVAHGAPVRLVAPALYGYKSVKHLAALEYRRGYAAGTAGWREHPRARVALEERSRYLPGPVWRRVWSLGLPLVRRPYRAEAARDAATGAQRPGQ